MSGILTDDDLEQLEAAADRPGRLQIIVHPEEGRLRQAATVLAGLLNAEPAEQIEAEQSRWTINDSRRCVSAAAVANDRALICHIRNAGSGDLDPLLKETERPEGRTIILTATGSPPATLRSRASTTFLTPEPAGRRRNAHPGAQQMRQTLQQDRNRAAALLRQHPDSAWGARLADSILKDMYERDLPDEIRNELLIQRSERRRTQSDNEAR